MVVVVVVLVVVTMVVMMMIRVDKLVDSETWDWDFTDHRV